MSHDLASQFEALIGKRVTIRLHDEGGGFRDIVGVLESATSLRDRHGQLLKFSHSEIFIWRQVIAKT
jgi:cysteinyl-tRNA synthetase